MAAPVTWPPVGTSFDELSPEAQRVVTEHLRYAAELRHWAKVRVLLAHEFVHKKSPPASDRRQLYPTDPRTRAVYEQLFCDRAARKWPQGFPSLFQFFLNNVMLEQCSLPKSFEDAYVYGHEDVAKPAALDFYHINATQRALSHGRELTDADDAVLETYQAGVMACYEQLHALASTQRFKKWRGAKKSRKELDHLVETMNERFKCLK